MHIEPGDRLVIFRGTNGAQFLSLSRQLTNESALYEGREYPLIRMECTVGTWHADSAGYPLQQGSNTHVYRNRKKDRKRLCEETPTAEFD